MSEVYDFDDRDWICCPFDDGGRGPCVMSCALVRHNEYGMYVCSFRAIADELENISTALRRAVDR